MKNPAKHQPISLWRLVHLGQELDEIAMRLAVLAAHLQRDLADHRTYEAERRSKPRRGQ